MTMTTMRRSPLLLVALLSCNVSAQHVYTDSFPTNDEYDFNILDPHHIYGSPYGGFGRATRSRLGALPLHLPGSVGEYDPDQEPFYTEVRDGDGRLFACRVYHEDELKTLTDSMFDTAKTKDPAAAVDQKTVESGAAVTEDATDDVNKHATGERTPSKEYRDATLQDMQRIISIDKVSEKLKGVCTQIHMGWWSYEWCHDVKVTQFHIHMQQGQQNLRIENASNLGSFKNRKVLADAGTKNDPEMLPPADSEKSLGVIIDEFEDGDMCPETQRPRRTTVRLVCCSLERMAKYKNGIIYHGHTTQSNIAAIRKMKEIDVCNYYLEVCTPLLCEGMVEAFGNGLVATHVPKPEIKQAVRPARQRKENETIREILEGTLKNTCLRFFNGGWWVYEVCHGKHVRQYHETDKFDAVTGAYSRVPESIHMLGYYSVELSEGFPDEDEPKYVTNPTSDDIIGSKRQKTTDGSGAYFAQEYPGGDVCDHSDVTDAAIKAGNVGEGGIERATTVRYFCGKEFTVLRVNEDSTCHYVVDISMPDLCEHPLFKAPVVRKQVVKCLPVNEAEENLR